MSRNLSRTVVAPAMASVLNEKIPSTVLGDEVVKSEKKSDNVSLHVAEAQGFDEKETFRLLRKLDWHLIPFMSLIYL